jgi:hypothetical protein
VNTLQPIIDWSTGATNTAYVDGDRVFSAIIDRDYDHRLKGISTTSFANTYGAWVRYCVEQKVTSSDDADGDFFVEQVRLRRMCGRMYVLGHVCAVYVARVNHNR